MTSPRLTPVASLLGHTDRVWHAAWNPQGNVLATCSSDLTIRLWGKEGNAEESTETWVCKTILTEGHTRTVRQVAWSPCGNYLASTSFDATTCVWGRGKDGGVMECLAQLEGHENEVKGVSWSRGGNLLATCGRDKSVWVWEVTEDEDFECAAVLSSHTQDVKAVVWHPNKDLLVSCSYDNSIKMFKEDPGSMDDWICCQTLDSHSSTVWDIDFDQSGDRLVSVGDDRALKVWQVYEAGNEENVQSASGDEGEAWKCVSTISLGDRPIYSVSWCPTTGLLATAAGDNAVRILEESASVHDPRNAPSFDIIDVQAGAHDEDVNAVIWNPKKEGLLASVADDGVVKLWQWTT